MKYKIFKEHKEKIIQAGTREKPYYTNSSQLPVNYTQDAFEALDKQDNLQCKYTGGTVFHMYMSEPLSDGNTAKNLVKTVLSNYRLPYISITPTFSVCNKHGYIGGTHKYCPYCDEEIIENWKKNHPNETLEN